MDGEVGSEIVQRETLLSPEQELFEIRDEIARFVNEERIHGRHADEMLTGLFRRTVTYDAALPGNENAGVWVETETLNETVSLALGEATADRWVGEDFVSRVGIFVYSKDYTEGREYIIDNVCLRIRRVSEKKHKKVKVEQSHLDDINLILSKLKGTIPSENRV